MYAQRIASSKAVSTSGRRGGAAAAPPAARPAAQPRRGGLVVVRSGGLRQDNIERTFFGDDFGARDPFPGEIESGFGEKVLGNYNTDHIIKPPDAMGKVIGLAARSVPAAGELALLGEADRERLRQQVPGWRVVAGPGGEQCIQQEWSVKDADSAKVLVDSITSLAAAEGHAPAAVEAVGGTTVVARLTTAALGGLTEADFIVAAKVNALDLAPLLAKRKQRFWA